MIDHLVTPTSCPEPLYKNYSALGLRKITVIIKAIVEAINLPHVVFI
jgi:hypothetical protein